MMPSLVSLSRIHAAPLPVFPPTPGKFRSHVGKLISADRGDFFHGGADFFKSVVRVTTNGHLPASSCGLSFG